MTIVIADTGVLISLGLIEKIELIEKNFGDFFIANAVWQEINQYENPLLKKSIVKNLAPKVKSITSKNYLSMIMDYGESESVILYEELNADYLLIDDNRARIIAESLNINCIGTIGLLVKAKQKGLIENLKPYFELWLKNERYFSKNLLNNVLIKIGEKPLS